MLVALSAWCGGYAWELTAVGLEAKTLALKAKYFGVLLLPLAWTGFIFDFVARESALSRRIVGALAVVASGLLALAWTDGSHHLFWGDLHLEGQGDNAALVGRGPGFWANITITYASLLAGIAVLVSHAVQSPYLYAKRASVLIVAVLLPWVGNMLFLAAEEGSGVVDPTPFLFSCTAVLAAVAVFRYGVLDPIPTLRDTRIEIIGDALIIVDRRRRVADLNRAAAALLGTSRADAAGSPLEDVLPGLGPFEHRPSRVDLPRRTEAGDRIFDASVTPIETRERRLTGHVVLLRDVTERRHLEEQLRQAQKMEAVGKLAGGVAHDFNNLLTAIIGFAALAEDELPPDSRVRESLTQIQRSAEQAASLTRQLLAFGRRQILRLETLDVAEVVRAVEPILRRLIGEDILVTSDVARRLPAVRADRTQLTQVLLNLAVNGRDAMPRGGTLTIRTRVVRADGPAEASADLAPGVYVVLEVADTGAGMTPEEMEHIFEPFYTTKPFGHGTGLGLSTVYGIAKQSGGDVRVQSAPGQGSIFAVYLPAEPEPAPIPGPPALLQGPEIHATVLLVEDDEGVREFATEVLRSAGCVVLPAASPSEALAVAARQSRVIDVLLADVVLPGMSGGELADRLVQMRPDLGVLFMTGYDDRDLTARGLVRPGRQCLAKPFTPAQLRAGVRSLQRAARPG
jgi:PAS domain S-box-containing protein